jgi:uncharacterized phiE125 gp8 family phage protein
MQGNIVTRYGPGAEPVSLTEAKAHCRVDSSDEDSLLSALIDSARGHVESAAGRSMLTRIMRTKFDRWYCEIGLSAPLRKVIAVTYLDSAGALQTLASSAYVVDQSVLQGAITRAHAATWPVTFRHPAAVAVDYVAGYATPFTVNSTTNTLLAKAHPFASGDPVRLSNSGGDLPAGLLPGVDYFAIGVSANALQLAETEAGTAIEITGDGTGTHFAGGPDDSAFVAMRHAMLLLIGHWFDNRSESVGFQTQNIPMGVDRLLAPHKVWGV